jgi:hypothetical protein
MRKNAKKMRKMREMWEKKEIGSREKGKWERKGKNAYNATRVNASLASAS